MTPEFNSFFPYWYVKRYESLQSTLSTVASFSLLSNHLFISSEASRKPHFCENIFLLGFPNISWKCTYKCHQCPHAFQIATVKWRRPCPDVLAYGILNRHETQNRSETLRPIRDTKSWNLKQEVCYGFGEASISLRLAAQWKVFFYSLICIHRWFFIESCAHESFITAKVGITSFCCILLCCVLFFCFPFRGHSSQVTVLRLI